MVLNDPLQNSPISLNCHTVAVFSDIHSNLHGFQACYLDAKAHGADSFIFLGDYISDLADPQKTLDLVYEIKARYPTVCLRGNRERYMLEHEQGSMAFTCGSKTGSLLYTYDRLREKDLDFIKSIPIYNVIELNGIPVEIAHSVRDNDRLYFEPGDETIDRVYPQMEQAYLLTGHSHRQYMQSRQGKTIINPGSVGVPQGGSRWPQYALLDYSEGMIHCRFRQVPYDLEKVIHAQFENGLVSCAGYWAISILYDLITGEEYTMKLLDAVSRTGDYHDEENWRKNAIALGMKFTEEEIVDFLRDYADKQWRFNK